VSACMLILSLPTATDMTWKEAFSVRLLYGGWMFAVMVLATTYTSSFYSTLSVPESDLPLDTLDQLVKLAKTKQYHIYILNDHTSLTNLFLKAKPASPLYTIGRHINW